MRYFILFALLGWGTSAGFSETANPHVPSGLDGWQLSADRPDQVECAAKDGVLRLARKEGESFARLYQDFPVKAGQGYVWSGEIKTEGSGFSRFWFNWQGADGTWTDVVEYGPNKRAGDWESFTNSLAGPANARQLRVSLGVSGSDTVARFRNLRFAPLNVAPRAVRAPDVGGEITVDGRLDEEAWTHAAVLNDFRVLGDPEQHASLSTVVRLAIRGNDLFIGYECEEPRLDALVCKAKEDTIGVYADDCVETFFSLDRQTYNHMIVNPEGRKYFGQNGYKRTHSRWYPTIESSAAFQGDWSVASSVGSNRWTVEIRVHLPHLLEGSGLNSADAIYMNFARHHPGAPPIYVNWAGLTGNALSVPEGFLPISLNRAICISGADGERRAPGRFTRRLNRPEWLLPGDPVAAENVGARLPLPERVRIEPSGPVPSADVRELLERAVHGGTNGEWVVTLDVGSLTDGVSEWSREQTAALRRDEAFRLSIAPGAIRIRGVTEDGARRGFAALILMVAGTRYDDVPALPEGDFYLSPETGRRGWVVDGRIPMGELREQGDLAYLLGLNLFMPMLFSYYGNTPFPFEAYPDVGDPSRTKAEWVEFFDYVRCRGMDPVPFWHAWGRAGYLAEKDRYRPYSVRPDLTVASSPYPDRRTTMNKNMDPANPETAKIVLGLQKEIVEALHPSAILIGHDELNYDEMVSELGKKKGWNPSDFIVESCRINRDFLHELGVKTMIWGDMLDPDQNGKHIDLSGPELLAKLPRDLVILDWKYEGKFDTESAFPSLGMFKKAGFSVYGCPWYRTLNVIGLARSVQQYGADGYVLTSWCRTTFDMIPSEMAQAVALGSYLSWSPDRAIPERIDRIPDWSFRVARDLIRDTLPEPGESLPLAGAGPLVTEGEIMDRLGMPVSMGLDVLLPDGRSCRGERFRGFSVKDRPAAIAVRGHRSQARLLRDPEFRNGLADWKRDGKGGIEPSGEAQGVRFTMTGESGASRLYQEFPLSDVGDYEVKCRMEAAQGGVVRIWARWANPRGKFDESPKTFAQSEPVTDASRDVTWRFTVPSGVSRLRFGFAFEGPGTGRVADVRLAHAMTEADRAPVEHAVIPVRAVARALTFWHTINRMPFDSMGLPERQQRTGMWMGTYRVVYEDGSVETADVGYRTEVMDWNDGLIALYADPTFYGTINDRLFFNLSAWTWTNPHPDRKIERIEVWPAGDPANTLVVFGVSRTL